MNDIIRWLVKLNITDDFKKIIKWLVIIIVVIFLLLIIWLVGYIAVDKYNDSKETMIALECNWDKFMQANAYDLREKIYGSSEKQISKILKEEGFTPENLESVMKNKSINKKHKMGSYKEWFLIQKQRDQDKPYGLYRGSHLKAIIGDERVYMQWRLKDFSEDYYYFGIGNPPKKKEQGHKINRKTLEISYYRLGIPSTAQCKEISEREFYRNVEREIKIKKDSVKF
jgi:hypothetical protein